LSAEITIPVITFRTSIVDESRDDSIGVTNGTCVVGSPAQRLLSRSFSRGDVEYDGDDGIVGNPVDFRCAAENGVLAMV